MTKSLIFFFFFKRKALRELQDVQILLLLKCVQLWAQRPQENDLMTNNVMNQVFGDVFYFLFCFLFSGRAGGSLVG